jgi:hypothetical protein
VGLLNNSWTERLVDKLRFNVDQPVPGKFVIRDRNNPLKNDWSVDYSTPYLDLTKDYALVLRMVDPKTEQTVIVAAGVTVFGTAAAGNFLTSKKEMEKLAAIAPPGWEKKNMELVLSTDVIKGRSGPASIVAVQVSDGRSHSTCRNRQKNLPRRNLRPSSNSCPLPYSDQAICPRGPSKLSVSTHRTPAGSPQSTIDSWLRFS